MEKHKKLFVWDFHGVLEKGNELAVREITNIILEQEGYPERLSIEDCRHCYGLKWREYFEHLLPDETPERWLDLQAKSIEFSDSHLYIMQDVIEPNDYAFDVLEAVQDRHDQILISNTTPDFLPHFLRAVDMERFFSSHNVFGVNMPGLNGSPSKARTLADYLEKKAEQHGAGYAGLVAIGDTAPDVELINVFSGPSTAYLYAHPGLEFKECDVPVRMIRDLRGVLDEL
jgi:phosphoglycolate phosphatase-like HAD superfamily hydrolase